MSYALCLADPSEITPRQEKCRGYITAVLSALVLGFTCTLFLFPRYHETGNSELFSLINEYLESAYDGKCAFSPVPTPEEDIPCKFTPFSGVANTYKERLARIDCECPVEIAFTSEHSGALRSHKFFCEREKGNSHSMPCFGLPFVGYPQEYVSPWQPNCPDCFVEKGEETQCAVSELSGSAETVLFGDSKEALGKYWRPKREEVIYTVVLLALASVFLWIVCCLTVRRFRHFPFCD